MFTRNGFNIYPRELERVVGAMPGVRRGDGASPCPTRFARTTSSIDVAGDVDRGRRAGTGATNSLSVYKRPSSIRSSRATTPNVARPAISGPSAPPGDSSIAPASNASRNAADAHRIELRAAAAAQLRQRVGQRHARSIRPHARHRVERVRNRGDARFERNGFTDQAVRYSAPVELLVMPAHDVERHRHVAEQRRQDAPADRRVRHDVLRTRPSVSGPGLFSTASRTPILPMSCTRPPISICCSASALKPIARAIATE